MYLSNIKIENFGPIGYAYFELKGQKTHVIIGSNGVGKTQLLAAVYSLFFEKNIIQHHADSTVIGKVNVTVNVNGQIVELSEEYNAKGSKLSLENFKSLLTATDIDRNKIYFLSGEDFERQNLVYTKEKLRLCYHFLRELGLEQQEVITRIIDGQANSVFMSMGQKRYIDTVYYLSQMPENTVLLGDSLLSVFDSTTKNMILEVFNKIKHRQCILFESSGIDEHSSIYNGLEIIHSTWEPSTWSPVSYTYQTPIRKPLWIQNEESDTITPILYRLNETLLLGECETAEFKEVKGSNPCNSIIATSEIYINAYLNSSISKTGKLFWGIDDNKIVKGVKLTYRDQDTIQKRIAEALSQSEPYISPDLYQIQFNTVYNEVGQAIQDCFVIVVRVFQYQSQWLFSTSKGEVFMKTVGGKKKLSPLEIQEQMLQRISRKR